MKLMAKKKPKRKPAPVPVWTPAAIRALRLRLGLTVKQAAEKVGVTARTWLAWELPSQEREPAASHLILIGLLDDGTL